MQVDIDLSQNNNKIFYNIYFPAMTWCFTLRCNFNSTLPLMALLALENK